MKKILLLSDTHENLDIINEMALKTKANLVIHAGDFEIPRVIPRVKSEHRQLHNLTISLPFRISP
jgi:predicted phosphodiesterase